MDTIEFNGTRYYAKETDSPGCPATDQEPVPVKTVEFRGSTFKLRRIGCSSPFLSGFSVNVTDLTGATYQTQFAGPMFPENGDWVTWVSPNGITGVEWNINTGAIRLLSSK